MSYKRVFVIIMDSVGTGAAHDAAKLDDVGSDILGHVGEYYKGALKLPNLGKLGISNLRDTPIEGVLVVDPAIGDYGKMEEISAGKDSMDGHWEMMGLPIMKPLLTFPDGFPQEIVGKLEKFSGRKVIISKPYSGTEVIRDYGERRMKTGELILYMSGDSVMQIAAHEDTTLVEELYKICEYARTFVNDPKYTVGRIIARPYADPDKDHFIRTANRHDFSLKPIGETDMDRLRAARYDVIGVGKINDIFSDERIDKGYYNESNTDEIDHVDEVMKQDFTGFCFTNSVDFDVMYGHRRNPKGFGQALMDFDKRLGKVLNEMRPDDLLMVTADHGNGLGLKRTDHTRENVLLLVYSPPMNKSNQSLGLRKAFSDLGTTILENFNVEPVKGTSFYREISND